MGLVQSNISLPYVRTLSGFPQGARDNGGRTTGGKSDHVIVGFKSDHVIVGFKASEFSPLLTPPQRLPWSSPQIKASLLLPPE